jgi:putative transport protein
MDWLYNLFFSGHGVSNGVIAICLVAVVGLAIGEIKIGAVKLGIAGPLFVGIAFGHFGLRMEPEILEFAREFGLILFVYAVGNAVGPTFFQSFKKEGALLNSIAASIVVFGALIAVSLHFVFALPLEVVVGLFSGGTTNTPSLSAGMEMLKELKASAPQVGTPGQAYAVAYPFGVVGILLTMGLIRQFFRVNVQKSAESWQAAKVGGDVSADLEPVHSHAVVASRVLHTGARHVVREDDAIGDTLLVDGPHSELEELRNAPGPIETQRFLVTRSQMLGQDLSQPLQVGVAITRVNRGGVELSPNAAVKLRFGDQLTCVGEEDALRDFAKRLGNDPQALQHTQMIPIFLGIFLGVLLGSLPMFVPGLPAPIKLGLAGGPVVVAILLSSMGNLGPLVWHMPAASRNVMREVGITLFMCCVGIYAGKSFVNTVLHGDGLKWMLCATLITFLPIMLAGLIARIVFKLNYLTICGVLAGSMTDPPALAFANAIYPSDAQGTAYAAVYPLTMCLRILSPQVILAALWVVS